MLDPVTVILERSGPHDWTATFELSEPAHSLSFVRSGDNNRVGFWTSTSAGVTLVREGETDVLRSREPRRVFSVSLDDRLIPRGEDYTPFVRISETATAVYLYQFQVIPGLADQAGGQGASAPPPHRFGFSTSHSEPVLFAGQSTAPGEMRTMNGGLGAYAVFGATEQPRTATGFVSLVSDEIPGDLSERLMSAIPALLDILAEQLGTPLDTRPNLIFARRPGTESGLHFRGGAMTWDIVMELEGDGLDDPGFVRSQRSAITVLVAHELVHLWIGGLVRNGDAEAAWLHEGAAEAFSWNALTLAFGTGPEFRETEAQSALEACRDFLSHGGLASRIANGERRAHYDCGALIMLALGNDLTPGNPAAGLSQLWTRLIEQTRETPDRRFDTDTFLTVFEQSGGSTDRRLWIHRLMTGDYSDATAILVSGLRDAGLTVSVNDGRPSLQL